MATGSPFWLLRTQIAYLPPHAEGDINHPDVQFGFVVIDCGEKSWCRFWMPGGRELRTKANSELVPNNCLKAHWSQPKERVWAAYQKYC